MASAIQSNAPAVHSSTLCVGLGSSVTHTIPPCFISQCSSGSSDTIGTASVPLGLLIVWFLYALTPSPVFHAITFTPAICVVLKLPLLYISLMWHIGTHTLENMFSCSCSYRLWSEYIKEFMYSTLGFLIQSL